MAFSWNIGQANEHGRFVGADFRASRACRGLELRDRALLAFPTQRTLRIGGQSWWDVDANTPEWRPVRFLAEPRCVVIEFKRRDTPGRMSRCLGERLFAVFFFGEFFIDLFVCAGVVHARAGFPQRDAKRGLRGRCEHSERCEERHSQETNKRQASPRSHVHFSFDVLSVAL